MRRWVVAVCKTTYCVGVRIGLSKRESSDTITWCESRCCVHYLFEHYSPIDQGSDAQRLVVDMGLYLDRPCRQFVHLA